MVKCINNNKAKGNSKKDNENNPFLNLLKKQKAINSKTNYVGVDDKKINIDENNCKNFYDQLKKKITELGNKNNRTQEEAKLLKKLATQVMWLEKDFPELKKNIFEVKKIL